MRELRRFDLDARALAYIGAQLHGLNTFCTALESAVAAGGEVFTFAPSETPLERLSSFEAGGLLREGPRMFLEDGSSLAAVSNLKQEQAQCLWEQLDPAVCISDDFNPRWSDVQTRPYFSDMPHAFGVGEEVYHLVRRCDGVQTIRKALQKSDTIWHGVTAVCERAPQVGADRTSSVAELQAAAASAIVITCTAYDGEGFVVWRRT